jgi:hypothetical protein
VTEGEVSETVRRNARRTDAVVIATVLVLVIAAGFWWWQTHRPPPTAAEPAGVVMETERAGDLLVTLSTTDGQLRQGRSTFTIEFRSATTHQLVDVGTLHVNPTMVMPGMAMQAATELIDGSPPGRYRLTGNFGMAGIWKLNLDWSGNGPIARGSVVVNGDVQ